VHHFDFHLGRLVEARRPNLVLSPVTDLVSHPRGEMLLRDLVRRLGHP
jgi:hypothetical protein